MFERNADRSRLLLAGIWAAIAGLLAVLLTQVTTPMLVVWLWLAMGMLVATIAKPVPVTGTAAKVAVTIGCVLLLAFAYAGASWFYADMPAQRATQEQDLVVALELMDRAIAINPLPQEYWRAPGTRLDAELWGAAGAGATTEQLQTLADRSIARHEAAVLHDPEDSLTRTLFVHALNQRQQLVPDDAVAKRAVAAAQELAAKWPNMPDAVLELGRAQLQAGLIAEAERSAETATRLDPGFSYAWLTLGEARTAAGDYEGALKALEMAVRLDPADSDARSKLNRLQQSRAQ